MTSLLDHCINFYKDNGLDYNLLNKNDKKRRMKNGLRILFQI